MRSAWIFKPLLFFSILTSYATEKKNYFFSADLLAWFPSQEVTAIWADLITAEDNRSSWKAEGFDFHFDVGVRLGFGHQLKWDDWTNAFYWSWFDTESTQTLLRKPHSSISPEFFAAFLSGNSPERVKVKWDLDFNIFDWELGRAIAITPSICLHPFIGLKGGWIDQTIHGHYFNLTIDNLPTTASAKEKLTNNFWGIGPQGGVNSTWKISSFQLVGDFSFATLWGSWSCEDFYKNSLSQTSSVTTKNSALGALMFRGFVGIGWERSYFSAKLGYETQIWLNQLRIATFQLQRLHGDLTFQGLTLNCQVYF